MAAGRAGRRSRVGFYGRAPGPATARREICYDSRVDLRRFFDRAVQASFDDLAMRDEPVAGYLADLLTRFARTEHLFPTGVTMPRLESVVDLLLEAQAAWDDSAAHFGPEREISIRRHIGDYTLFMTGIFRDHVERLAVTDYYEDQGRRAYRFVWETARAEGEPDALVFQRLADRFEQYAEALTYLRKVYFRPERLPGGAISDPFFRRLLTE